MNAGAKGRGGDAAVPEFDARPVFRPRPAGAPLASLALAEAPDECGFDKRAWVATTRAGRLEPHPT